MSKKKKAGKTKLHFRRFKWLYALIALEIVMVWFFLYIWSGIRPLSERKLESVTVCVEDTVYVGGEHSKVVVLSDGKRYTFAQRSSDTEYSTDEIDRMLRKGEQLHLTYFEDRCGLGFTKRNLVVEAHTDELQLRSAQAYAASKDGLQTFFVIAFIVAELLYVWGVFACFRYNRDCFTQKRKGMKRKIGGGEP